MFSRDRTLKKANEQLSKFTQNPDAKSFVSEVLNDLDKLKPLSSDQISLDEVNRLRKSINDWLKKNMNVAAITIDNIKLEEALHSALVAIASAKPLNIDDPMTLYEVNEDERIVTSDGLQFDASTLLAWINSKGKMQHPKYNVIFGKYDQANIIEYAKDKKINITLNSSHRTSNQVEDPGLLLGALAAMRSSSPPTQDNYQSVLNSSVLMIDRELPRTSTQRYLYSHALRAAHSSLFESDDYPSSTFSSSAAAAIVSSSSDVSGRTPRFDSIVRANQPSLSLPDWLSYNAAVTLPNGYIAIASEPLLRGRNHPFDILIIDPVNNIVVRRIQDNDDSVNAIALLENGNIAVGHYNGNANINIYNPESGARLKEIPQQGVNIQQRLMHAKGNNVVIFGSYNGVHLYDAEAGCHVRHISMDMQFNTSLAIGDKWIIISLNKAVVLDSDFQIQHTLNHETSICTRVVTLHNPPDQIAIANGSEIMIYDLRSGVLNKRFRIPETNVIRSMIALDNGNLVVAGSTGLIKEYTTNGTCISECKTDQQDIDSPVLLKYAYEQLTARHAMLNRDAITQSANVISSSSSAPQSPSIFSRPGINSEMIHALNILRNVLTVEHLRDWPSSNPFTNSHSEALIHLVRNEDIPVIEAINTIKILTESQVRELLPPNQSDMLEVD